MRDIRSESGVKISHSAFITKDIAIGSIEIDSDILLRGLKMFYLRSEGRHHDLREMGIDDLLIVVLI